MVQLLNKIRININKSVELFTIGLVVVLVVIVAAQVFWRYALSNSLGWSEELSRFLFIWIIFLGSAIALRQRAHIALDSLLQKLKGKAKLFLSLFIDLVVIGFAIIVFLSGMELVQSTANQPSVALNISMSWVYMSIPIAMALIIFNTVFEIVEKIKTKTIDISTE